MSLRSEFHEAYDELGAAPAGLSERVVMTAQRDRPRRGSWSPRMRAPLSLVAVFVVIVVVAGALVGGRLITDWKRLTAPPVPAVPQTPLQKLEARALKFQHVASMSYCPDGPYDAQGDLGTGPVHMSGSAVAPQTRWGVYFYDSVNADGPAKGPLLIRARELLTGHQVIFIRQYAAGPAVGTDVLDGQVVTQHAELVIQDVAPPYAWVITTGTQDGMGCEGWQIDGPSFSEAFYVRY